MDDYLVVGLIGRPHGIQGEVFVEPRTDEPDRRFTHGAVLGVRAPGPGPRAPGSLTVAATRWHRDRLLVRFAELADRTGAEAARGWELTVPLDPGETPEDPEEFYDHQLVGLRVEDAAGRVRGTVTRVEHGGGQDLLHLEVEGRDVLFPFVKALVPVVDVPGGRLVVDDRPGLLEDGA
jgi:16S rRNA processing protein RimM